ncbi:MAG: hypothetical protein AMXMBFR36_30780 [Acidobacteriota bacterium]
MLGGALHHLSQDGIDGLCAGTRASPDDSRSNSTAVLLVARLNVDFTNVAQPQVFDFCLSFSSFVENMSVQELSKGSNVGRDTVDSGAHDPKHLASWIEDRPATTTVGNMHIRFNNCSWLQNGISALRVNSCDQAGGPTPEEHYRIRFTLAANNGLWK